MTKADIAALPPFPADRTDSAFFQVGFGTLRLPVLKASWRRLKREALAGCGLERQMRTPLLNALIVLVIIDAVGWAVGVLLPLRYALTHKRLPTVAGIRLLGGPFEALGINALIVAGLIFVAVSALKLLSAYWLWNLRLDGAVLQLILLGLIVVFWYGFDLPFGPPGGIAQVVLMALVWKNLH